MRLSIASGLLILAGVVNAASQWSFSDGTVVVSPQGSGQAPSQTEKFTAQDRIRKTLALGHADTVMVSLTTTEGSKPRRPHQAFLLLKEPSGLEAPFPLTVKDSGKGVVEFSQRNLPFQLLAASSLEASLVIGSFGSSSGAVTHLFDIEVQPNPSAPVPNYEAPLRYGKRPEIHHIFRADPKSPPPIVSSIFVLIVIGTIPPLFSGWMLLDANLDDLPKALGAAPLSHALFFGSIVTMEGVFLMYYSGWNLFETLPVIAVVGVVAFLSGSRALGEVRSRRLAGAR